MIDSFPFCQVEIEIASNTSKQEEDQTDYYPGKEAYENIRNHRPNKSDDKESGRKEHDRPIGTENDVHHMTAHSDTGHRKTSLKDQMNIVRLVNTGSLPPRAMNSLSPSTTVNLQVVQENIRDIQEIKSIFSEQRAPPTHVKFGSQFFKSFIKTWTVWKLSKGHCAEVLRQYQ